MRCPSCMAENAATRRFCAQCGVVLPVPCLACGFENETAARFCGGCGRALGERAVPEPTSAIFLREGVALKAKHHICRIILQVRRHALAMQLLTKESPYPRLLAIG